MPVRVYYTKRNEVISFRVIEERPGTWSCNGLKHEQRALRERERERDRERERERERQRER